MKFIRFSYCHLVIEEQKNKEKKENYDLNRILDGFGKLVHFENIMN